MQKGIPVWIFVLGCVLFGTMSCSRENPAQSIVGVWKGTDEFGHEHFFEFHKDGSLSWWNVIHSNADETFVKSPTFPGTYERKNGRILAKSKGIPPQSLGRLTLVSINELKQDATGHALRMNLAYNRVNPL
jgi:hypothetical protein